MRQVPGVDEHRVGGRRLPDHHDVVTRHQDRVACDAGVDPGLTGPLDRPSTRAGATGFSGLVHDRSRLGNGRPGFLSAELLALTLSPERNGDATSGSAHTAARTTLPVAQQIDRRSP
ncbi:hypothetical protein ATKI12_4445 [Kitasatospora sp. Ki12]